MLGAVAKVGGKVGKAGLKRIAKGAAWTAGGLFAADSALSVAERLGVDGPGDGTARKAALEDLLYGARSFDVGGNLTALREENALLEAVGPDLGPSVVGEVLAESMLSERTRELVRGQEEMLGALAERGRREASLQEMAFRLGIG